MDGMALLSERPSEVTESCGMITTSPAMAVSGMIAREATERMDDLVIEY